MGVKLRGKGYKRARKHKRNCPCFKCIKERDAREQARLSEWLKEPTNGR